MPRPPSGPKLYVIAHPRTPYQVRYRHEGKAVRQHFADREGAEKRLAALQRQYALEGTAGLAMDAKARSDYFAATNLLGNVPLLDAVHYYVRHHAHVKTSKTLTEVVKEWRMEMEVANLAMRTRQNLRSRVEAWIRDSAISQLNQITREAVMERMARETDRKGARRPTSARTRVNDLTALRGFCRWLKANGYIPEDPAAEIPFPRTDAATPQTLAPEQARALMRAAAEWREGVFAPYFALALFAGLRPTEIAGLQRDQIKLDGRMPTLRVVGGKKRRSQRLVPVLPVLRQWLNRYKQHPYKPTGRLWKLGWNEVRAAAGLKAGWVEDLCRHSWVSYRLAEMRDEGQVAREAGHLPDTLFSHYFDLRTRAEAREYFGIVPATKRA